VREYGAMTNSCVIQGWACAFKTIFRTCSPTVACDAVGVIIIMVTDLVGYAETQDAIKTAVTQDTAYCIMEIQ
jgi:hypothetical protein